MDLSERLTTLTLNDDKYDMMIEESLKKWMKGCEKLQPDTEVKQITDVYQSHVRLHSAVLLKLNHLCQIDYYKVQVLKHKKEDKYWLFRTWGTIVTPHGSDLLQKLPRKACISKYKYLVKSRLKREFRTLDIDQSSSAEDGFESKLPASVQRLMKLIFNTDNIQKVLKDFKLDMEKLKPGQLSNKKIRQAYGNLKIILQAITVVDNPETIVTINEASARFYSCIPHEKDKHLPLLNNRAAIREKLDMLDELYEINLTDKIMNFRTGEIRNVLDIYYDKLKTEISELGENSKDFRIIEDYIKNTHSFVHNLYEIDIEKIFTINRSGEAQKYANCTKGIGNKTLLWHGTKMTNISSILLRGLRIPRKSSTGHMFGRGIYFADVVSKSANYCRAKGQFSTAVLVLCEVALGNIEEVFQAENNFVLPKRKHSAFARGRYGPDSGSWTEIAEGVKVPFGKLGKQKLNEESKLKLLHNEYVVYNTAQIRIKYLVQIKFSEAPRHSIV